MYRFIKPTKTKSLTVRLLRSYTTAMNSSAEAIKLTSTESRIQKLLLEFCSHYNAQAPEPMVLRITGGWVRDKLMGRESHDIDIAINVLSGEDFVTQLKRYLDAHRPDLTINAIHTIKKNPEKSKHLETCTAKLFDLDIDFVNLRSEKYTVDSRIPIVEFGTAEEDALRRDATLNALFYNLNEDKIEDFTGRGLADLRHGVLRTPLAPLQTFLDDPLRVLRLIRFASRFNFIIEHETMKAMQTDDIKMSLVHKISRERVGDEVEKILVSSNPEYGLNLINYTGLSPSVFDVGIPVDDKVSAELRAVCSIFPSHVSRVTFTAPFFNEAIKNVSSKLFKEIVTSLEADQLLKKVFWCSVLLAPFGDTVVTARGARAVESILKSGLRFGKHIFGPSSQIDTPKEETETILAEAATGDIQRSALGLYLVHYGEHAKINLLVKCYMELLQETERFEIPIDEPKPIQLVEDNSELRAAASSIVDKYEKIFNTVQKLELEDAHKLQPILDGKIIAKELNKKPGPWLADVKRQVLVWQLDNPQGTPEQCLEHLKQIL